MQSGGGIWIRIMMGLTGRGLTVLLGSHSHTHTPHRVHVFLVHISSVVRMWMFT